MISQRFIFLRSFSRFSKTCRNRNILNLDKPNRQETVDIKASNRKAKSTKWSVGAISLLAVPIAAFSLGCWQVYRLQWKLDLIEALRRRLSEIAIEFPTNDISQLDKLEYRRVRIKGEFLHDREFIISPRGRFDEKFVQKDAGSLLSDNNLSSHGGHVITPFKLEGSNLIIMVNRGWLPVYQFSRETRIKTEPRGKISLEAIVRKTEKRPQFVGHNKPEQGVWFYKDFLQMSQYCGSAPIYVEAVYENSVPGEPIGGQTNISVRNDHLSYLITWFSLSAVTTGMWIVRFRK